MNNYKLLLTTVEATDLAEIIKEAIKQEPNKFVKERYQELLTKIKELR